VGVGWCECEWVRGCEMDFVGFHVKFYLLYIEKTFASHHHHIMYMKRYVNERIRKRRNR
jgi:hypothetical protein